MSRHIHLGRARGREVEPVVIHIGDDAGTPFEETGTPVVPDFGYGEGFLERSAQWFDAQAETLEEALLRALPGGTYDRLLARMLRRKASHFAIPWQEAER